MMIAPSGRPTPKGPSRQAAGRCAALARDDLAPSSALGPIRDQRGFLLIEVLISAGLVALIAVATFTGFQAANRSTATDRTRVLATQLVAEKQEELRAMTTTKLEQFEGKPSTQKYSANGANHGGHGVEITLTSSVAFVTAGSNSKFACESTSGATNYIQTTTEATWAGENKPVRQTSVVTVPPEASIEVKVKNQENGSVEGATVEEIEEGKSTGISQVTPASGCVIFGGLTSGHKEKIKIRKSGWANSAGEAEPSAEAAVSSGTVVLKEFVIAPTGNLQVKFTSNGASAEADTFVAYQTGIKPNPFYQGGTAGTFASSITSPNLYPFAKQNGSTKLWEGEAYTVYAGDCTANNPETVASIKPKEAVVTGGATTAVTVEAPPLNIIVYQAKKATVEKELKEAKTPKFPPAESLKITNKACEKIDAQNATSGVAYQHVLTGGLNSKGELVQKAQPYAKELELCVAVKVKEKEYWKTTKAVKIANAATTGSVSTPIYMEEQTKTTTLASC